MKLVDINSGLLPLLELNADLIKEPLNRICTTNQITFAQLVSMIKSIPEDVIPYTEQVGYFIR